MNKRGVVALLLSAWVLPALAQESALGRDWQDKALSWNECPAFLPKGCGIAVLHGDPAQANADIFFKVPGRSQIPLHWHSSAERMVLVAGELHVRYQGQAGLVLKPGSYAYGPARQAHEARCVSSGPCVLFIAFEGAVDALPGSPE